VWAVVVEAIHSGAQTGADRAGTGMRFRTHNNLYTLTDAGDGAWYISGNEKYCPKATLVTLREPVQVGHRCAFNIASPTFDQRRNPVTTTTVLEIME